MVKNGAAIHFHGWSIWFKVYLETPYGTAYLVPSKEWDKDDYLRFFKMPWQEQVQVCRRGTFE